VGLGLGCQLGLDIKDCLKYIPQVLLICVRMFHFIGTIIGARDLKNS